MKTFNESVGNIDIVSLSHRRLHSIIKDPSHPHHSAAKAEMDRRTMTKESTDTQHSDKHIKQAFGVLNDPRYKGGNYSGAHKVINKIKPGLADHPSVKNAMKRANEDAKPDAAEVIRKKKQMAAITTSDRDKLAKIRQMIARERK